MTPKHTTLRSSAILGASLLVGGALLARRLVRQRRKIDLTGRVVLITGGSRGLGLALAMEFARRRMRIALCARTAADLDTAAKQIRRINADVHPFVCDLADPAQIAGLIDDVEKTCGPIDVLVNNAGTISVGPLEAMTTDDFRRAMDVNFWSAVHASMAVLPGMRRRGAGRIVNIASIGGKIPVPHLAPYCASKFALVGFSSALRTELAKDGILVTTINPGLMRTGSARNASFKGKHRAEYAWFAISDALPGLSISAASAARRIANAAIYGEADVTLGPPAKLAAKLYGMAPGLTTELTALAARLFPRAGDSFPTTKHGHDSESWITRSVFNALNHRAEREYNQL